jgi:hypothetical protein
LANRAHAQIFTSNDAITWSEILKSPPFGWFNSIAFNTNSYLAIGKGNNSGDDPIYTSANGVDWQKQVSSFVPTMFNLVFAKDKYYALSAIIPFSLLSTVDGITWEKPFVSSYNLWGLLWGGDQFVVLGTNESDSSFTYTSIDGKTWQINNIPGQYILHQFGYGNNIFMAMGQNNFTDETAVFIGRPKTSIALKTINQSVSTALKYSKRTIIYNLTVPSYVLISLVDIQGRLIINLVNKTQSSGSHTVNLPRHFVQGTYIISLKAGMQIEYKTISIGAYR